MTRRSAEGRTWRIPRSGLVVAIVTFLVLGSSVGAYAYWTAQGSVTSTAKAGSIAVTLAGFASMQNTFVNDTRTRTGSVLVTNTSTSPSTTSIPVSVALGYVAGGSSVLATNLDVVMWGPMAASSCTTGATPSGTIKTGTWASFPSMTDALSAGQAKSWCVRTSNVERSKLASSSGTLTIQPTATATLTAGTWTATASATTTQDTQYIFPATTPSQSSWYFIKSAADGTCLDANGGSGAGTEVIQWPCKPASQGNDNQQWQFGNARANGYYDLKPKHAQTTRWDAHGSLTAGTVITIENTGGTDTQLWQFQQIGANQYQIVNYKSGLCVQAVTTLAGGQTAVGQALCNGSTAQRYLLVIAPVVLNLVCTPTGGNKSGADVIYSWNAADAGSYTFQADNGGWQTIGTSAATDSQITIDGTQPTTGTALESWNQADYNVRALDSSNNVVGTSKITVANKKALGCP